jgi:hypothetical protein
MGEAWRRPRSGQELRKDEPEVIATFDRIRGRLPKSSPAVIDIQIGARGELAAERAAFAVREFPIF